MRSTPCAENDPELWFDTRPTEIAAAKRLCLGCPVRDACLKAADDFEPFTYGNRWGVWGGLSAQERDNRARRLKERRGLVA